jgi:hypothetical protein
MSGRVFRSLLATLCLVAAPVAAQDTPVNTNQIAVLMMVDYGRSYGYQVTLARIQLDIDRAELERDRIVLRQKEELYRNNRIPQAELEIAQLKDEWNRRQLVVSEKSLVYVSAEYEAMIQLARHFGGGQPVSAEALYGTFRRGWDAGCDKGPDEVAAMKARMDFLAKSVDRARQLLAQQNESYASVLEKEAQLRIATADHDQRAAGIEKCRSVLFPSLADILAVKP